MSRLRTQAGWLIRGSDRANAAAEEILQLRVQLDELRSEVTTLRSDLEAARQEGRGSVTDLTARLGSMSERLEQLGG